MDQGSAFLAALAGAGGAIIGAVTSTFNAGRSRERIENAIAASATAIAANAATAKTANDNIADKLTYICDELARRLTILENRYQYDGTYSTPRRRLPPDGDARD